MRAHTRTPREIAADMFAEAERYLDNKTTPESHTAVVDALWAEANTLGTAASKQVGALLCAQIARKCAGAPQPPRLPKSDRGRVVAEVQRPAVFGPCRER